MTWIELLKHSTWSGTFVLLAAFAASRTMRRAPSSWRHFLWTTALYSVLLLPLAAAFTPRWRVAAPGALLLSQTVPTTTIEATTSPAQAPPFDLLLAVWLSGFALTAAWFLIGRLRLLMLLRRARHANHARDLMDALGGIGVPVLQSAEAHTAMATGLWRSVVVLPDSAGKWPAEQLRAALLHELMHVRRRDLAAQSVAQAACCLYWFHPLVWLSARALRLEREQACDDAVLTHGMSAHEYAGHLVALVRTLRGSRTAALGMAEPSELESRVKALLDPGRDRRPLNRLAGLAMVAALALMLLPVTAFRLEAQAAPLVHTIETAVSTVDDPAPQTAATGSISGLVEDPRGARVPGSKVLIKNVDIRAERSIVADATGQFRVSDLPIGKYMVIVSAAGFRVWTSATVSVEANLPVTVKTALVIGELAEAMTVTADRPLTAPAPTRSADPRRIRIGGNVQPAKLLYRVAPVYPEDMKAQGVTGVVQLAGIIGKQGFLSDIQPVGGPPGLVTAAVEAVSHWIYQPALLNGEPVPVMTNIDIAFELKQ